MSADRRTVQPASVGRAIWLVASTNSPGFSRRRIRAASDRENAGPRSTADSPVVIPPTKATSSTRPAAGSLRWHAHRTGRRQVRPHAGRGGARGGRVPTTGPHRHGRTTHFRRVHMNDFVIRISRVSVTVPRRRSRRFGPAHRARCSAPQKRVASTTPASRLESSRQTAHGRRYGCQTSAAAIRLTSGHRCR